MKRIPVIVAVCGILIILLVGYFGVKTKNLLGLTARLRPSPPVVMPRETPAAGSVSENPFQPDPSGQSSEASHSGHDSQPPAAPGLTRVPPQIASVVKTSQLEKVVRKYAQKYGVDEDLVWVVIRQESGFNPYAVSPKGAMGLMQLMPGTASALGVTDPFDVEQNIAGGIKYLERCLNKFNQDVCLALAAYNAGPDNVTKYQGCPPFPETRNYVASIIRAYAGEPIRQDLRIINIGSAFIAEVSDPPQLLGLPWRIPIPKWRIATPEAKLCGPRWKVTQRPF